MDDERVEELGSLTAIFPELIIDPTNEFAATLELPVTPTTPLLVRFLPESTQNDTAHVERDVRLTQLPPLSLRLTLPADYPADIPPKVGLKTQYDWLPKEKIVELEAEVANQWEEYGHCQILFAYIDFLQQAAERGFDLHQSADGCLILPATQESTLVAFSEKEEQETFNQGTYDCGICLEPKKGSACYRMKRCGHVFCKSCLQDFYNDAIKEGNVNGVECLDPDCGMIDANGQRRRVKKHRLLHPRELLAMEIEESVVRRYVEMKRKKRLEADKTTVYCPRTWCTGPAKSDRYPPIPADLSTYVDNDMSDDDDAGARKSETDSSEDGKVVDRLAVCEKCQLAFCRVCYHGWHGHFVRCRPRDPNELSEEEKASYDYLAKYTSPCGNCNAPVSKTMGCNHMTCLQCRYHFCYLCSAYLPPDNPYQHFNQSGMPCFQRLWELEEGDNGQVERQGGYLDARHLAREADEDDAERAAAEIHAEEQNRQMRILDGVPDPHNDIPLIVAMAGLDFVGGEMLEVGPPPARNPPPRRARGQQGPFPRNPPARGAAQAVLNHERGRGRARGPRGHAGGRDPHEMQQRQQAELQRFLAMAARDEEEGWNSDELGDDDDEFVIPRR